MPHVCWGASGFRRARVRQIGAKSAPRSVLGVWLRLTCPLLTGAQRLIEPHTAVEVVQNEGAIAER